MTFLSRSLAVVLLLPLGSLVAACSADPSTSGGDESASSSSSDALSTSDALARAEQWVAAQLKYCQAANHGRDYDSACSTYCSRTSNPAWDPYRSDCSGLVSWAWGLPAPGRVTGEFAPFQSDITHVIPASSLQPGDAVNNSDHIMLFKAWVNPGKTATFIEEPGCSTTINYAHEFTSNVTLNGTSISVAYNGMTFSAIRYTALTAPVPPVTSALKGAFDAASCSGLTGWAEDTSAKDAPIDVSLSFDAAEGKSGGEGAEKIVANVHRPDLCSSLGSCDHGFSLAVPLGIQDGKAHQIFAYAVPSAGKGSDSLLSTGPKSVTCPFPTLPVGPDKAVKRLVASPQVFGAWQLSGLTDVAHEAAATVDAYPKGEDLPASPTVVKSDDGSPEVWVIDGDARRLVPDANALAAWHFTAATWPAAKLTAVPQGPNWPGAPMILEAEGAQEMYALDGTFAAPAGGPASNAGASTPPQGDDPLTQSSSGGCSASRGKSGSLGALLLGLTAIAGARRRRGRPSSR